MQNANELLPQLENQPGNSAISVWEYPEPMSIDAARKACASLLADEEKACGWRHVNRGQKQCDIRPLGCLHSKRSSIIDTIILSLVAHGRISYMDIFDWSSRAFSLFNTFGALDVPLHTAAQSEDSVALAKLKQEADAERQKIFALVRELLELFDREPIHEEDMD